MALDRPNDTREAPEQVPAPRWEPTRESQWNTPGPGTTEPALSAPEADSPLQAKGDDDAEKKKQERLKEAERRENEVIVPPQRRTDSLPPTEDLAAAAMAAKLTGGITRLDVIRESDVAGASGADKAAAPSARSGSRAGERTKTL